MKQYKRAMAEQPVPPELIDATAAAMHKQLDNQKKSHRPVLFVVRRMAAVAAMLALISTIALRQNDRLIKTTLTADGVVTDVVLKNGELHFEQARNEPIIVLPDIRFGIPSLEKHLWEPDQYEAYLGKELSFPGIPEDMTLVVQRAEVAIQNGEKVVSDDYFLLYQNEDEQSSIEIHVAKGKLPSGSLLDAAYSSHMEDVPLYVSWNDKENVWQAQFLHENVGYQILCTGITQEAFIRLLYSVVAE